MTRTMTHTNLSRSAATTPSISRLVQVRTRLDIHNKRVKPMTPLCHVLGSQMAER